LRELGDEISTLVRQEIALAKVEIAEKTKPAIASAGMFGGTALLSLGAFGALTTSLIALGAVWIPAWASALIVTVVYGIVAFALAPEPADFGEFVLQTVALEHCIVLIYESVGREFALEGRDRGRLVVDRPRARPRGGRSTSPGRCGDGGGG